MWSFSAALKKIVFWFKASTNSSHCCMLIEGTYVIWVMILLIVLSSSKDWPIFVVWCWSNSIIFKLFFTSDLNLSISLFLSNKNSLILLAKRLINLLLILSKIAEISIIWFKKASLFKYWVMICFSDSKWLTRLAIWLTLPWRFSIS